MALDPIKHDLRFKNILQKACLLGVRTKVQILAYKKNKLQVSLISILFLKNINEECFMGYKSHARDVLSLF